MSDKNGFNESFKILKENAEKLRNQDQLDIDALVPLVEDSTRAYKICKERIEAVKMALAKHLSELDSEAKKADSNGDLDIPF